MLRWPGSRASAAPALFSATSVLRDQGSIDQLAKAGGRVVSMP
jgi:hypothetical protein